MTALLEYLVHTLMINKTEAVEGVQQTQQVLDKFFKAVCFEL